LSNVDRVGEELGCDTLRSQFITGCATFNEDAMKTIPSSPRRPGQGTSRPGSVPVRWLLLALAVVICALPHERAEAQTPFIGQIQMFAGTFAPVGWMFCEGQILSIAEYETLFNLLGTTYGGDGVQTFALPDLRGRVIVSAGLGSGLSNYVVGQTGGEEAVTLTQLQLPAHQHSLFADSLSGSSDTPSGLVPADGPDGVPSFGFNTVRVMAAGAVSNAGGGQPHTNVKPYLAIRYIIAVQGIFPSRN
jgi:microcystin-dependent protein